MNYLKGNPFQIAISTVIAMALANSFAPVMSQYRGENEKKWAASILSDIKNGASAEDICRNASSSATASDEISFKDWAYSVARKYCTSGFQKKKEKVILIFQLQRQKRPSVALRRLRYLTSA